MNKRKVGNEYEDAAAAYLEKKGYRIIARNERNRAGEVDIICVSPDGMLVFTEVKYRKDEKNGNALEAVDIRKQARICRASLFFLNTHRQYLNYQVRYDVIGITGEKIEHIENAFDYAL